MKMLAHLSKEITCCGIHSSICNFYLFIYFLCEVIEKDHHVDDVPWTY